MVSIDAEKHLETVGPELDVSRVEALIDQIQVINEREGGLIEAYVPIGLINQEDVAVDRAHVLELAESIKQQSKTHEITGQLSPVLLGHLPGQDNFVILDGYHRVPAVKLAGSDIVYATIKTDCTPEDVVDLRIVAASSHKKVKFARIVEWVEEAWGTTSWANNVSAYTAFVTASLNSRGTGRGNGNGLTDEDVQDVKRWVRRKCEQWDISLRDVAKYLQTARVADPELVKIARERAGGHKLEVVTPKHLGQIARHLPNDYPMQWVVAMAAVNNTLTVGQTQSLSLAVSKARTYQEMDQFIDTRGWDRMTSAQQAISSKRYREIDPNSPESYVSTLVDKFFDDQIEIVEIMIENAILKGTYKPKTESVGKRMNDFLILSDVVVEDIPEELPASERMIWSKDKLTDVADKIMRMKPFLANAIRRQFPFNDEDIEDILQVAAMRFLDRVNDGRLPEKYGDNNHLRRLMANIATYAAIDEIRKTKGRRGQKLQVVSLDEKDDKGCSLEDILATDDAPFEEIEANPDEGDFIKNLLPFLYERERRILIMKAHFELTFAEIANIIGTTTATIAVVYNGLKKKAIKLSEEAQAEVLHIAD